GCFSAVGDRTGPGRDVVCATGAVAPRHGALSAVKQSFGMSADCFSVPRDGVFPQRRSLTTHIRPLWRETSPNPLKGKGRSKKSKIEKNRLLWSVERSEPIAESPYPSASPWPIDVGGEVHGKAPGSATF